MPPTSTGAFERALRTAAAATQAALEDLLPEVSGNRLRQAMRYAVLAPGKRLRPFFVIETARLHGVADEHALRVGAAIECLHCYSLVHDDLPAMDNDDLRRGLPTLHRRFDEATAILAGDALLTFAFEVIAAPETHGDAVIRSRLMLELARAAGQAGMVGGQMLDIEAETRNFASLAEISAMQAMKTGALFRFACMAGPLLAGDDAAPLRQYAEHAGLAFQIADDILDVESSAEALGKATQKDSGKGKATFVDMLGIDGARREAERLTLAAQDALSPYGSKADTLREAARYLVTRRK